MEIFRFFIYNLGMALFFSIISILLIFISLKSKSIKLKHILLYISTPFIALFLFEVFYFSIHTNESKVVFSGTFANNPMVSGNKPSVGYGPLQDTNFQVTATRKNGDSLIYNVIYTFQNGKRFTPNNNPLAEKNAYFLGCSITFGDGLNDNQTLPHFFNEFTNHTYNVTNYGFSGYGSHHALKIVEDEILKNKNIHISDSDCAIYSFIPEHIERTAGNSIWDAQGPCYEIEKNELIYKGAFDSQRLLKQNLLTKKLKTIWRNSAVYKSILTYKANEKDVYRVVEIIKRMNDLLISRNIRFIIIMPKLNNINDLEAILYQSLKQNNIEHYFVDSIINVNNLSDYRIEGDGHPNEKYNIRIAQFLTEKLQINQQK